MGSPAPPSDGRIQAAADAMWGALGPDPSGSLLAVDFDGTLAPIVDDPARSSAAPGALDALDALVDRIGKVAVISGRPVRFLVERLRLADRPGLSCFGLYGLEEALADGTVRVMPHGDVADAIEEVARAARSAAPGARVEMKDASVALHFREAPSTEPVLRAVADEAVRRYPLSLRTGRLVFELVPAGAPDKGTVVRRIAAGRSGACAIGDDVGDVAAFVALDALAREGLRVAKIAVGGEEALPALIAAADAVIASQGDVVPTLAALAALLG